MNSIYVAHVADALDRLRGESDYDETADFAAQLLDVTPSLDMATAMFVGGTWTQADFDAQVQVAIDTFPVNSEPFDTRAALLIAEETAPEPMGSRGPR